MSNLVNISSPESTFKPTYLYIKQHSVTGKLYFGMTTSNDPIKCGGSGKDWKLHIKKHGKDHVVTLWYCLFLDKESIKDFAIMCSKLWCIVESSEWLNNIPETGYRSKYSFKSNTPTRCNCYRTIPISVNGLVYSSGVVVADQFNISPSTVIWRINSNKKEFEFWIRMSPIPKPPKQPKPPKRWNKHKAIIVDGIKYESGIEVANSFNISTPSVCWLGIC